MKLWLIRHAKSSWSNPGQADFDRPLNARGERDGPRMLTWLAGQADPADWLWTSNAARALATSEFVIRGFNTDRNAVTPLEALYHAGPENMLDIIRQTPATVSNAALIAHNPGITYLVNNLAGHIVTDNIPTFGVAKLDVQGAWHEVDGSVCELEIFASPKTIT